ncbi:ImmA/IrrE family metallo-endopeptidase [Vibrio fluvialis]|uniref:ImmA/IrrE family metallo-endopeptidase n=2 Tax=Vibrio fluvialis TaxID=676 RepID=UPI000462B83E|nr:ImmA/IrrE family metallo-endopeptidase [Vibrio fluvialis]MCG6391419.1 ImmA/IrrE family metallo-endopeptidase [Vibrio fluvialis]MCG6418942.1 ImmA/IrrE family metallo-endopeptidase [Vibrio fluvialis]
MAFIRRKPKSNRIPPDTADFSTAAELLELAKSHDIATSPLDVSSLTRVLGIKMLLEPMDGEESGSLTKDKKTGQWVMKVNSLHHFNRQRFTIAHELGHFIKHSMQSENFEDASFFRNGEINKMESEANLFAAELLMPEDEYHDFVKNTSKKVDDIAQHFLVSSMAVRIRAKQLGYEGHNV